MHTLTRISLASALALLAIGTASCTEDAAAMEVTAQDQGRTIHLDPSQELALTLESNASTGFRWVVSSEPDAAVLEIVDSTYVAPDTGLVGAPGQEVWTFRAVDRGRTTFALSYERSSGESSGTPFELIVEVG
jgi:inhibitor of cysteine peptidase